MAPETPFETPVSAPPIITEGAIMNALGGITRSHLRRLVRLGLVRWSPAGVNIVELRGQKHRAERLEKRVARLCGDRLTRGERNSAVAWLVALARREAPLERALSPTELRDRVSALLDRLEECRS